MNKRVSTGIVIIVTMLLTLAVALAGFTMYLKMRNMVLVNQDDFDRVANVQSENEKYLNIQGLIDNSFLWDYDKAVMDEEVYRAMLGSLGDVYTRYLNEEEFRELVDDINSSFTGAGIVFAQTEKGFLITEVIKDGPAYSVGIKAGDHILKVDGKEFDNSTDMAEAIRGEAGTTVKLLILRDEKETEFNVVRGKVDASVEGATMGDGKIGYIKIRSFGEDTAERFDSMFSSLESQGIEGLIIDLRNNGGGFFNAGVSVADRLMPEGLVSYAEDKNGNRENYNSDSKHTTLPIVVLVNSVTASASEMLAAALKDNGATIVGETTCGKGIIQETHVYNDGTAVSITVKEFFSPKGNKIQTVGVEPDEVVPYTYELAEDTQLNRAIEILTKK